jgi:hypothetical protein
MEMVKTLKIFIDSITGKTFTKTIVQNSSESNYLNAFFLMFFWIYYPLIYFNSSGTSSYPEDRKILRIYLLLLNYNTENVLSSNCFAPKKSSTFNSLRIAKISLVIFGSYLSNSVTKSNHSNRKLESI